jgi:chromosome segregation ATPase
MSFIDDWKKVKSKYKELADTSKFEPDLGALVSTLYSDIKESRSLDEQAKKCGDDLDRALEKLAAGKAQMDSLFDSRNEAMKGLSKSVSDFVKDYNAADADLKKAMTAFNVFAVLYMSYSKTRTAMDNGVEKIGDEVENTLSDASKKNSKISDDIDSKKKKLRTEIGKLHVRFPMCSPTT